MAAGDPIRGTGGSATIGSTPTTINHIKDYEYKAEFDVTEAGPYVGDATVDEVPGGEKGELTVNCDVREGGDPGQTAVTAAKGTYTNFVFTTTGGKVLTFATALVKSISYKTEAKGTQTFSFTITGVAVITQQGS